MSDNAPLLMQIEIPADAGSVFRALTGPTALRSWLAEDADVDLAAGRYTFWGIHTPYTPASDSAHMRLLDYQPGRLLQFAWLMGQNPSTVRFKLLERGNNETVLSLIHQRGDQGQAENFSLEDYWFAHLENLRRYVDGKASEARIDFSSPMTGDIRHALDSTATSERIFTVLTQPKWMERWIASDARVELKRGGNYDLGWGIDGINVVDFECDKRLSISWQEHDEAPTRATWRLEDAGGKTHIRFEHTGFNEAHPNHGIWAGWLNYLNWIRSVAEYGRAWQPPAIPLAGHPYAHIYPRSMQEMQAKLLQSEIKVG